MSDSTFESTPQPRWKVDIPVLRDKNGDPNNIGTAMPQWYAATFYFGLQGIAATVLTAYGAHTAVAGITVSILAYLLCMLLSVVIAAFVLWVGKKIRKNASKRLHPMMADALPRVFSITIAASGFMINKSTSGAITYHGTMNVWAVTYIPEAALAIVVGLNILGTLLTLCFPAPPDAGGGPDDPTGTGSGPVQPAAVSSGRSWWRTAARSA